VQVRQLPDPVDDERARWAAGVPLRLEHEVVDDELPTAIEDVGQGDLTVWTGDPVVHRHLAHRQLPPGRARRVPLADEFLLADQQLDACGAPLLVGHHGRYGRRWSHTRGGGRRGPLPRIVRVLLHHRSGPPRGWWLHGLLTTLLELTTIGSTCPHGSPTTSRPGGVWDVGPRRGSPAHRRRSRVPHPHGCTGRALVRRAVAEDIGVEGDEVGAFPRCSLRPSSAAARKPAAIDRAVASADHRIAVAVSCYG
jgi:hypothetical protein